MERKKNFVTKLGKRSPTSTTRRKESRPNIYSSVNLILMTLRSYSIPRITLYSTE
jgi:hypothetical protein